MPAPLRRPCRIDRVTQAVVAMAVAVDVVKSVAGLYRHMEGGSLSLTNTYVDIDGECEVEGREVVCHRLHFKDCRVVIRNVRFTTTSAPNGKCVEVEDCGTVELEGCTFSCTSASTDLAPYPAREATAAAIYATNSEVRVAGCTVTAPGVEARGLVVAAGARATVTNSSFTATFNSAVWCWKEAWCRLEQVKVKDCGG